MAIQMFVLTRLVAKTWGIYITCAWKIYTKVIRSVLLYRAAAWHMPTPVGAMPCGIAQSFQAMQQDCLRVVTGAYKATPAYNLESEAWVLPIDLYLNRWAA